MYILPPTCTRKAGALRTLFAYLNLFVFSMHLLVMGGTFVIMFIGWEGVGLCSTRLWLLV
jgi:NADH:ubiquinone oxidoreductase subunit 5 (subunit L)/multisubunit Na+/H+ antiporter MnhA subunit